MRAWMALVLALVPLGSTLAAQDKPGEPLVRCVKCKNVGSLPCPAHDKGEAEYEERVKFCSTIHACTTCQGVGAIDCADCARPDVEQRIAAKLAGRESCARRSKELDDMMKRPLRKVLTAHCELVFEIDSLKVDKRNVAHHELMHIYADRLEALFADYLATLGCQANEFQQPVQVFVWWLPSDQLQGSLIFAGQANQMGVKLLGSHAIYSVCGNRQYFTTDERLHRNIVHNVSHLLLAHQAPSLWIGNIKGGWAEEGLGHWFEERYFKKCDNYCYEEQNTNEDFKGGNWKPVVRKMVALDDVMPVSEVMQLNTDQLPLKAHALAFSYVDYLLAHEPTKFNALCRQLRRKAVLRDAFKAAYEMSLLEFEVKWKAWVLETYPAR